ncbi:unnamed protein product [Rotaria sp. Silwood2]|nr:unnamed protein product [Rotaria sp. Silwood2]
MDISFLCMDISFSPILPNEMIDRISKELSGIDLFHFTLANHSALSISNYHLIQLLYLQPDLSFDKETKSLLDMRKSPHFISENGIMLTLSSYKWNNFVYGAFTLTIIENTLKHHSTNLFYLLEPRILTNEESILFKIWDSNQNISNIVINLNQFIENLTCRYEYDTWRPYIDWDIFVIAGGSIFSSLLVEPVTKNTSDIDLLFLKQNSRLFKTADCLQALNSGHTTCYAMPVTTSQYMRRVSRLLKYQQRGFNILCPEEFDINAFLATSIEHCNESQLEKMYRFRRRHFNDNYDSFCLQKKFCKHYNLT